MQSEEIVGGGFVELQDCLGSDLTVVNAARVSFSKQKEELDASDVRLIKYLAKHEHFTPFAQPQIRFRIKMPLFVARQWYKHTVGLTRNEISRRYVSFEPDFFLPTSLRLAADNVKQGSSSEVHDDSDSLILSMKECYEKCLQTYHHLLSEGVCAEQARIVLPQSMFTEFIETGSLAAYARIFSLRAAPSAQKEIQSYAIAVGSLIAERFYFSWDALTSVHK